MPSAVSHLAVLSLLAVIGAAPVLSGHPEPVGSVGLRIGILEDVDSLNPLTTCSPAGLELSRLIYGQLVAVGEDPAGGLASVESSADGLAWTYTLREAFWHDGQRVTADDVTFTLGLAMNGTGETDWSMPRPAAVNVVAGQVVLEFDQRPKIVPGIGLPVLPEHLWSGLPPGSEPPPIGAGPFALVARVPGDYTLLRAVTEDTALEYIAFVVFGSADRLLTALVDGEVDVAVDLPPGLTYSFPAGTIELGGEHGPGGDDPGTKGAAVHAFRTDRFERWARTPSGVLFNGSLDTYLALRPVNDVSGPGVNEGPAQRARPWLVPVAMATLGLMAIAIVSSAVWLSRG